MSSVIGTLEAAIVARLATALTVQGQAFPKVDVRAWPERARDFKMTHPSGCAMVIYKGSKFAQDGSTAGQLVSFDAEFEIGLISRTLREPNLPSAAPDAGVGIYELLQTCRGALFGWQPTDAAGPARLRSEDFDDYAEGTWGYSLRLSIPMVTVAERMCPPGPWVEQCCTADTNHLTTLQFIKP